MVPRLSRAIFEELLKQQSFVAGPLQPCLFFMHDSFIRCGNFRHNSICENLYKHVAVRVHLCVCVGVQWKERDWIEGILCFKSLKMAGP